MAAAETDRRLTVVTQAHTEDQLKVLKTAYLNPDATPHEVAGMIDDDALGSGYCERVMNDFVLPEGEKRALEDERSRGKEIDNGGEPDSVWYECALCEDFRSDDPNDVRRHVSRSVDARHRGRRGDDPGAVVVHGDDALIEANRRAEHTGLVTDRMFDVLWAIHRDPGASQGDIAGSLGLSRREVGNAWRQFGAEWGERAEVAERVLPPSLTGGEDPGDGDGPSWGAETLPEDATKDDTEWDTCYYASVNNTVEYGVFVTLAPGVTGLVYKDELPDDRAEWPREGDTVVVRLKQRRGDGGEDLSFEYPDQPWDAAGLAEPAEREAERLLEEMSDGRVRAEKGTASYEGPAGGIDATGQTIGERPVKSLGGQGMAEELDAMHHTVTVSTERFLDLLESDAPRDTRMAMLLQVLGRD